MNADTKRKNLVFIAPKFYDYHEKIRYELEKLNFKVFFFENVFFREDPLLYNDDSISRFKRFLRPRYKYEYNINILNQVKDLNINMLFCIGGFSVTEQLILNLKRCNPKMKTVMYFWDSFQVWDYRNLISLFDQVYTFDRNDALAYNLSYLPLFYSFDKQKVVPYKERDIDLLFIGSLGYQSENRLRVLAYFEELAAKHNLNVVLWLYVKMPKANILKRSLNSLRVLFFSRYGRFITKIGEFRKSHHFIKDVPISSKDLPLYFQRAKCVIDIPIPNQIGLTMRTIESLAAGAKLVTTNAAIKKEYFYDMTLVNVIREDHLYFDINFLNKIPIEPIDIEHLSLKNWLKRIVSST